MSIFWQEVGGWARAHSWTSLWLSTSSSDEAVSCIFLSDGIEHRYYALFTALSVVFLFTCHVFSPPQSIRAKDSHLHTFENTVSPTTISEKSYLMLAIRSKPPSESFNEHRTKIIKPISLKLHESWFRIFPDMLFIVEKWWLQAVIF